MRRSRWAASAILAHKAVVALTAFCVVRFLPELFDHRSYIAVFTGNYGRAPAQPPTSVQRLALWDAHHYLLIARHGYPSFGPELAFYPLWPWVIRAGSLVTGRAWISALVLSNLFSLLALLLLHDLARRVAGTRVARWTLALMLVFPGAMFLCTAYSESLFLFLAVAVFHCMNRNRIALATLAALLLPLCRPVGILFLLPTFALAFRAARRGRRAAWLLPAAVMMGYAGYFIAMRASTGDALAGFRVREHFTISLSLARAVDPVAFVGDLLNARSFHGIFDSALDRVLFLVSVAALVPILRRPRTSAWLAYAVPMAIVPAVLNRFEGHDALPRGRIPVLLRRSVLVRREAERAVARRARWARACGHRARAGRPLRQSPVGGLSYGFRTAERRPSFSGLFTIHTSVMRSS